MRQKLDLSLGLPPLGDVFVGADPAAVFERLMVYCNQSAVTKLLKEYSFLAAIDERFARRMNIVHATPRIVADHATVGQHIVELHAGAQPVHRLIIDPAELLVDEL